MHEGLFGNRGEININHLTVEANQPEPELSFDPAKEILPSDWEKMERQIGWGLIVHNDRMKQIAGRMLMQAKFLAPEIFVQLNKPDTYQSLLALKDNPQFRTTDAHLFEYILALKAIDPTHPTALTETERQEIFDQYQPSVEAAMIALRSGSATTILSATTGAITIKHLAPEYYDSLRLDGGAMKLLIDGAKNRETQGGVYLGTVLETFVHLKLLAPELASELTLLLETVERLKLNLHDIRQEVAKWSERPLDDWSVFLSFAFYGYACLADSLRVDETGLVIVPAGTNLNQPENKLPEQRKY